MVRVFLVDDHDVVRQGVASLLSKHQDIRVVGQAADGQAAIEDVRRCSPDLVIMDVGMAGLNGIEATRRILAEHGGVKVLALSMHAEKGCVNEMLAAGASGYLLKNAVLEELYPAIQAVDRGEVFISPALAAQTAARPATAWSDAARLTAVLSPRERQILQHVAEGCPSKDIATRLHISIRTVDAHRRTIMRKLHIHTVAELTKMAVREGLTDL
jgi:DNA-binding NarL/FixJ family response regulator